MKKILFWIVAALLVCGVAGTVYYAVSCDNETAEAAKTKKIVKTPLVTEFTTDVVNIIAIDKQAMFLIADSAAKRDYRVEVCFFESQVELTGNVDTLATLGVKNITNVFQLAETDPQTHETFVTVYGFVHNADGESYVQKIEDAFWVGDCNIIDASLKVNLAEAFTLIQEVNFKKPNSRFVTLRAELGPHYKYAQWIFGNASRGLLYVDSETGTVTDTNPVYEAE